MSQRSETFFVRQLSKKPTGVVIRTVAAEIGSIRPWAVDPEPSVAQAIRQAVASDSRLPFGLFRRRTTWVEEAGRSAVNPNLRG